MYCKCTANSKFGFKNLSDSAKNNPQKNWIPSRNRFKIFFCRGSKNLNGHLKKKKKKGAKNHVCLKFTPFF